MKTYDPTKVTLSIAGIPIEGYAPGTFVKVDYDEDTFTKQTGADAQTARTFNANLGGSAEITLQQSSKSNDALAALAALDRLNKTGVGAFLVADKSGTARASAQNCWIKKSAPLERGKELTDTTWTIDIASPLDITPGGTTDA